MATFSGDVQYTLNGTFNNPWQNNQKKVEPKSSNAFLEPKPKTKVYCGILEQKSGRRTNQKQPKTTKKMVLEPQSSNGRDLKQQFNWDSLKNRSKWDSA